MWKLKYSTNLLSPLARLGFRKATFIQTFDFSIMYTFIAHDLLKSRMKNIINNSFKHKNGGNIYTANGICKMIEFLVDNMHAWFGRHLFRQTFGIPKETNCVPLLAALFFYSYENEFLDKLIKESRRKLARKFNL